MHRYHDIPDSHAHTDQSRFGRRYAWGRAYRDGSLVCGRVHVTFDRDERLGLAPYERRYVLARFLDRLHPTLRSELAELTRTRGAAARRAAERIEPIVIVVDDPRHGRDRIVGRIVPPQVGRGDLRDVEFGLRELTPVSGDEPTRRLSGDEIASKSRFDRPSGRPSEPRER